MFSLIKISSAQSSRTKFCALTTFVYRLFFHLPAWLILFLPQGICIVFSPVQLPRLAFDFPQFANQMPPYGQGTSPPTTTFSRITHCLHPNLPALYSAGKWLQTQNYIIGFFSVICLSWIFSVFTCPHPLCLVWKVWAILKTKSLYHSLLYPQGPHDARTITDP